MASVQGEHGQMRQGIEGPASFVKSHMINVIHVCDVHVLQRGYQIIRCDMCLLGVKHDFQKPVYQQRGIVDQEMCLDPFREPVVYGAVIKVCFHDLETVFNLISFLRHRKDFFAGSIRFVATA